MFSLLGFISFFMIFTCVLKLFISRSRLWVILLIISVITLVASHHIDLALHPEKDMEIDYSGIVLTPEPTVAPSPTPTPIATPTAAPSETPAEIPETEAAEIPEQVETP